MRHPKALAAIVATLAAAAVANAATTTHDPSALAQPPSYVGLRLDRAWAPVDTAKTVGAPTNFSNAPLPANVQIVAGSTAPADIANMAASGGTNVNRSTYTSQLNIVPGDQKLEPIGCNKCARAMAEIAEGVSTDGKTYLGGGFPIPSDFTPPADRTQDTDQEIALYQPDYVNPCTGWKGRYYEAFDFHANTGGWTDSWGVAHPAYDPAQPVSLSNVRWTTTSLGRALDMAHSPGHYHGHGVYNCNYSQPGAPDSAWEAAGIGVLAAQTFIVEDEISREDCATGRIDHEVGLLLPHNAPGFVWPAQHGDGFTSSLTVKEGMRFRLPAGLAKPPGLSRLASMLFDAAQKYGLVDDDITGAAVGVRTEPLVNGVAAPECLALFDGKAGWQVLGGFPWGKLQQIAVGSDANPNPTG